jgi:prevent-host-death family protein
MARALLSQNVIPLGEFKSRAAVVLEQLADDDEPRVLTRNGRAAAVLLSPAEFDRLGERDRFLASVGSGLADAEAGRTMDSSALRERLAEHRSRRTGPAPRGKP